ncbi:MAG: VOC family protein [Gammaproteobacteria bacterium]|nr:VOC family protein [Gammaproteobacteria bacterium]
MNDTPQVSRLVRTALFVSDLDRSSRFYKQGLGYHEVYSGGELTHKVAHALPEDSAIRYEIVKVEGPNFGMIGMFEVKPSPPPVSRRTGSVNVGEGCLVLLTTDIRAVRDRLVDMGAEIVCEPQRLVVRGTGPGSLEMTCRDPDGMLINLIERPVGSF